MKTTDVLRIKKRIMNEMPDILGDISNKSLEKISSIFDEAFNSCDWNESINPSPSTKLIYKMNYLRKLKTDDKYTSTKINSTISSYYDFLVNYDDDDLLDTIKNNLSDLSYRLNEMNLIDLMNSFNNELRYIYGTINEDDTVNVSLMITSLVFRYNLSDVADTIIGVNSSKINISDELLEQLKEYLQYNIFSKMIRNIKVVTDLLYTSLLYMDNEFENINIDIIPEIIKNYIFNEFIVVYNIMEDYFNGLVRCHFSGLEYEENHTTTFNGRFLTDRLFDVFIRSLYEYSTLDNIDLELDYLAELIELYTI